MARRTAPKVEGMRGQPVEFHVFQCKADRDFFMVTDEIHLDDTHRNDTLKNPGEIPLEIPM